MPELGGVPVRISGAGVELTAPRLFRMTSECCRIAALQRNNTVGHVWTAPAVQEEEESDSERSVRVQPCIRPVNAAVLAAGPDVIR